MDALDSDDVLLARSTPPAEKLRQALEMMAAGFALRRAALRSRFPEADEAEIEAMFTRWLAHDE